MNRGCSRGRRGAASQRVCAFLIGTAALLLMAVGCRNDPRAAGDIAIHELITPQPVHTGTETISFQLTNHAGQPVSAARVQVEADMNHPGMAPVFANAIEAAPGSYRAQVNFSMGGDWVVLFHITRSDGRKAERQMSVLGVASN